MNEETTTQEHLRALLTEHSPAEAADRLLKDEHPPMKVLDALVREVKPVDLSAFDTFIRERVSQPMQADYEAYVALQNAKESAPPYVIDRDMYAVRVVAREGHERDALRQALPYVVDLPHPSADRPAVVDLLLAPEAPPDARVALPGFTVLTPLTRVPEEASRALEPPSAGRQEQLAAQLAALDAERHQVVVRDLDGGVRYLAPERDGAGFVATDRPTYLTNDQVMVALPVIDALGKGSNIDLVSESARHHYVVLDGLDARQARDLDDRFGANLVMRVGDEHMAVVRLSEEPERAAAIASLLRARYPSGPDLSESPERVSLSGREGLVEIVSARAEDVLPPKSRYVGAPDAASESPAAVIERFAEHRSEAERAFLQMG